MRGWLNTPKAMNRKQTSIFMLKVCIILISCLTTASLNTLKLLHGIGISGLDGMADISWVSINLPFFAFILMFFALHWVKQKIRNRNTM